MDHRFQLIVEHMKDVIGVVDAYGMITYVTPSSLGVLGQSPDTYLGKELFGFVHPQDSSILKRAFFAVVTSGHTRRVECRYKEPTGGWSFIEIDLNPVVEGKTVKSVVVAARDITKRKHMDELLINSDKLVAVGQLAAGVAHEIRNPLTSLKGFLKILRQRPDKTEQYIDIMSSELDRMERIINEFLVLAKPHPQNLQEEDVAGLISSVVTLLESQAILHNVQIVTHFTGPFPLVRCDGSQMKQVFVNVIKNAIEAMPTGGVLEIHAYAREVEDGVDMRGWGEGHVSLAGTGIVGADREVAASIVAESRGAAMAAETRKAHPEEAAGFAGYVVVEVRDQGTGVSPEDMDRVGQPFFTTKSKGTGLGLMISRQILKAHRASMNIESHPGEGTIVSIELPIHGE